jgi:hypothetical protein
MTGKPLEANALAVSKFLLTGSPDLHIIGLQLRIFL